MQIPFYAFSGYGLRDIGSNTQARGVQAGEIQARKTQARKTQARTMQAQTIRLGLQRAPYPNCEKAAFETAHKVVLAIQQSPCLAR